VLAHVGPVLLLDVRVVVFLVGPAARELNAVGFAVPVQMRVDKFRPVVPSRHEAKASQVLL
jgi:hypothetical protein